MYKYACQCVVQGATFERKGTKLAGWFEGFAKRSQIFLFYKVDVGVSSNCYRGLSPSFHDLYSLSACTASRNASGYCGIAIYLLILTSHFR